MSGGFDDKLDEARRSLQLAADAVEKDRRSAEASAVEAAREGEQARQDLQEFVRRVRQLGVPPVRLVEKTESETLFRKTIRVKDGRHRANGWSIGHRLFVTESGALLRGIPSRRYGSTAITFVDVPATSVTVEVTMSEFDVADWTARLNVRQLLVNRLAELGG